MRIVLKLPSLDILVKRVKFTKCCDAFYDKNYSNELLAGALKTMIIG